VNSIPPSHPFDRNSTKIGQLPSELPTQFNEPLRKRSRTIKIDWFWLKCPPKGSREIALGHVWIALQAWIRKCVLFPYEAFAKKLDSSYGFWGKPKRSIRLPSTNSLCRLVPFSFPRGPTLLAVLLPKSGLGWETKLWLFLRRVQFLFGFSHRQVIEYPRRHYDENGKSCPILYSGEQGTLTWEITQLPAIPLSTPYTNFASSTSQK